MELEEVEDAQEVDEVEAEIQISLNNLEKRIVILRKKQTKEEEDNLEIEVGRITIKGMSSVTNATNMDITLISIGIMKRPKRMIKMTKHILHKIHM